MRPRLVLAIVIASVLITPFRRELYVGDETKYSQVVREMRASGHWFVPTLEGSPFTHKPPLHFWLMDALTYPFGVYQIWPYVLPSLAAFALLLLLLFRWGGPMAAFVCGTSLLMWGSAQTARMDVSFTALLALAAWWTWKFFEEDDRRALLPAALMTGIATLVKGPMAPVMFLCLVAFEAMRRRRLPRGNYLAAILILVAVPLLWFLPAIAIGGEAFWREIFYKQTVGRAVGAWVHRSPPWFYVMRAPLTLFPWFFLLVAALVKLARRPRGTEEPGGTAGTDPRFFVMWILSVLVPYSLISSKLDVYMMAMLPPVALTIARYLDGPDDAWGRRANAFLCALLAIVGVAGATIASRWVKEPDRALVLLPEVRRLFVLLAIAAAIGFVIALRAHVRTSTLAAGFVPLAALVYIAFALTPLANELATTRPLVRALAAQNVPPEQIALHACPHLWTRAMPRALWRARHVDGNGLRAWDPTVIVTSRKHDDAIAYALPRYRKVGEFRMIGKWFDVYRR
ncbi:MAG TPA: glycosyltransferase family 39 protein [Thermoanaerobaculia bacterium]|jgi:4-amino-4-deoxy-L-arabinose transferase-like glycosyltransferase